jgi:hypothetical protein
MIKFLVAIVVAGLLSVIGIAVALFHFWGWQGMLAFPIILYVLVRLLKRALKLVLGPVAQQMGLALLSPTSHVLEKATMTVRSLAPAPMPVPDGDEGDAAEPRHYYDVEVIITPQDSTSNEVWKPAEIVLTSQQISSVEELRNLQVGFPDQILVRKGARFVPDDSGGHSGQAHLKITFAVKPGTSSAWVCYYGETIGSFELPPWNLQDAPLRPRSGERTERSRSESATKSPARVAAEKQARRGDGFQNGSGKPEPELKLYQPPDENLDEDVDADSPMNDDDAALDRRDERRMMALPLGESRFGGVPDLPPGIPWPVFQGKKLPLLAQVDLSALPKSALPSDGWLYAFGLCDDHHTPLPLQVIHHRGPRIELVRAARPGERELWKDWTGNRIYSVVPLKSSQEDGWDDCGHLLGKIKEEGENAAAVADAQDCSGNDWITLMIIPSVGSMMWSDCGLFHVAIRRSDLAKNDFSKVCASLSCVC